MPYETILTETPGEAVGLVRLNRPQALNALNRTLTRENFVALEAFDRDDSIGCMMLMDSDKAFAAVADIKEMVDQSAVAMMSDDFIDWSRLNKPVIAALSGWALGGGCELAMTCDLIVASVAAKFGHPEISIGFIPGAGGTQKHTHAMSMS